MTELQNHTNAGQRPLTAPTFDIKGLPEKPAAAKETFYEDAHALVTNWRHAPFADDGSVQLMKHVEQLNERLKKRLEACAHIANPKELSPALELLENVRLLRGPIQGVKSSKKEFKDLIYIRHEGIDQPRILLLLQSYFQTAKGIWSADSLAEYVGAIQEHEPLLLGEIRLLSAFVSLAQLQFILDSADDAFSNGAPSMKDSPFSAPIHSLRRQSQFEWSPFIESLAAFHSILANDPHGVFLAMDEETRADYMSSVAELAKRSDSSELQVAQHAARLANDAELHPPEDDRLARRLGHVGYYLLAEGLPELKQRIGYHYSLRERLQLFLHNNNEDIYILSIFILSVLSIAALILPLVPYHPFLPVIGALFLALLPATHGVSDLVNNAITSLVRPRALPKLDYTKGIPDRACTFVVVPTLLLNETQVIELFEELESRWLANADPNLHFGLLTDLPDSTTRPHPEDSSELVELAIHLTNCLNEKYKEEGGGAFILLHRHRIFNSRQGVWMGWERKRGKLLDLNKLLLGDFDNFPIKAGPTHVLSNVRYVITLDSDTQLPRNTAARMIGTIDHPLNQAIIDPRLKIVTKGYGILQPRVGVSVSSASRSRLAAIYSGETGFDIYTRAVSDVYQDLFGEGIFTGKGIYEANVLYEVLNRRFPRNTLLSHDLIEGAYARAGLVTDIEIIDDYPSHYSAHTRRKHRWVRGDWQITQWLLNRVPDESGKFTENPISLLSQWKIFDNLRRSLVEPITFILLVSGWLFLPGGGTYWTVVTLLLILLPVLIQLAFHLGDALFNIGGKTFIEGLRTFWASLGFHLLNLIFLPHQTLLSLDAIIRSLVRRFVTGRRLLEWETAAQAEANRTKSSLDIYLQLSPLVALVLGNIIALTHKRNLIAAVPVLLAWALAPAITGWLNSPPRKLHGLLSEEDYGFLEHQALLIWRFYSEFATKENHYLIPDNVEERGKHQVPTLSPTNVGMLLNARQSAIEFGFITLPEFAQATLDTLNTFEKLEKVHGHIYNWYNIPTLEPIPPFTISSVDSGNLAASLYTLHAGTLDLQKRAILTQTPFSAIHRILKDQKPSVDISAAALRDQIAWLDKLSPIARDGSWAMDETERRRQQLHSYVTEYVPWLLPRYAQLFSAPELQDPDNDVIPLMQNAVGYVHELDQRLMEFASAATNSDRELAIELRTRLATTIPTLQRLAADLHCISERSERFAHDMRFDFLVVKDRQLLAIGFDGRSGVLDADCYDLLASETRTATFLAVANGELPQRSWFRLDRTHNLVKGRACMYSWSGTMFEFLMPALWMRQYPDTLMSRSIDTAIHVQQTYISHIPWGISESGKAQYDTSGRYGYQAWGIPALALKYDADAGPVISPYSTFLALPFSQTLAVKNLRRMVELGWVGDYGFYEAADYTVGLNKPDMVRSWMAHHQGMSLLSITNLLHGNIFQTWFHANPRIRAAELLLHERPLSRHALKQLAKATQQQFHLEAVSN